MNIWKIVFNYEFAYADICANPYNLDIDDFFASKNPDLNKIEFGWICNQSDVVPDIAIIRFNIICFSKKALDFLTTLLTGYIFTQIKISDDTYYAIFNLPEEENKLNKKKSKIEYFSTGDIREVVKPIFLPGEYKTLFQIPEALYTIFSTQDFKDKVEENNLSGLNFEECAIKSKSWF